MRQDRRKPRRVWLITAASWCVAGATSAAQPVEIFAGRDSGPALATPQEAPSLAAPDDAAEGLQLLEDPVGLEDSTAVGVSNFPAFRGPHSQGMELVSREADEHSRRGFELAGRRAYFSAREEFILSLRTLSQALDVQQGVTSYSAALAAGLRALDEAKDFIPRGAGLEANLNVAMIVTAHETPVYREESTAGVSALVARQRYYTYAREQLGVCVGQELAGSMALHGLGKLYTVFADEKLGSTSGSEAEAMVFYQAALLVSPGNHMAANDLGVLLAKKGSWREARESFGQSITSHPTSTAWNNLARAERELGAKEKSAAAQREAQRLTRAETPASAPARPSTAVKVEWVRPDGMTAGANEQFLNNRQVNAQPRPAAAPAQVQPKPAPPREAEKITWPWQRSRDTK